MRDIFASIASGGAGNDFFDSRRGNWSVTNEKTRLMHCPRMHRDSSELTLGKWVETPVAGTKKGDYFKESKIQASFVKRGRPFGVTNKKKA